MFMQNLKNAGIFVVVACIIAAATYLMFSIVRFIVRKLNPDDEYNYNEDDYIDAFVSITESMYMTLQASKMHGNDYIGITTEQYHYIVDCIEANMSLMLKDINKSGISRQLPLSVVVGTVLTASCIGAMDAMFKDARPATYDEMMRDPKTPMAEMTKEFRDYRYYIESLDDKDGSSLWELCTGRSRNVDG